MTTEIDRDAMTEKIRAGRALPLEDRQARWDRVQAWKDSYSLAEMAELELQASGFDLTRERIRAIRDNPRPGSVGRPKLPGLLGRRRRAQQKLDRWKGETGVTAERMVASARAELAELKPLIRATSKAEQKG